MINKVRAIKAFPGVKENTIFVKNFNGLFLSEDNKTSLTKEAVFEGIENGFFEIILAKPRTEDEIRARLTYFEDTLTEYLALGNFDNSSAALVWANLIDCLKWVLGEKELVDNAISKWVDNKFEIKDERI